MKSNPQKASKTDLALKSVNLKEMLYLGLQSFVFELGMHALHEAMAVEVSSLAGPRYAKDNRNEFKRWGARRGIVYFNGQKVGIRKPRVMRKCAGRHKEIELQTYKAFSKPTAMKETVMAKVLTGIASRDYTGTITAVLESHGIESSAVNQAAIENSGKAMEAFCTKQFKDQEFVVIIIDDINILDRDSILALGVDMWGKNQILALRHGNTRTSVHCSELLDELVGKGLSARRSYLFVINNGDALAAAIKEVFGPRSIIQRSSLAMP